MTHWHHGGLKLYNYGIFLHEAENAQSPPTRPWLSPLSANLQRVYDHDWGVRRKIMGSRILEFIVGSDEHVADSSVLIIAGPLQVASN
jgi:hypothetical protein